VKPTFKTIQPHSALVARHEEDYQKLMSVPVSQLRVQLLKLVRPVTLEIDQISFLYRVSDAHGRYLHIHPQFDRATTILWDVFPELYAKWHNTASTLVVSQ
jgi:hypothetical protein